MEFPASTSRTTSRELERLGKEQALGKAANLGRPGFEAPVAGAIRRSPAEALTASAPKGDAAIQIPKGEA